MTQSRRMSILETTTQVVVGLILSWCVTYYGLPLFGLHPSAHDATAITAAYSVLSWLRSYTIRRTFAGGWRFVLRWLCALRLSIRSEV